MDEMFDDGSKRMEERKFTKIGQDRWNHYASETVEAGSTIEGNIDEEQDDAWSDEDGFSLHRDNSGFGEGFASGPEDSMGRRHETVYSVSGDGEGGDFAAADTLSGDDALSPNPATLVAPLRSRMHPRLNKNQPRGSRRAGIRSMLGKRAAASRAHIPVTLVTGTQVSVGATHVKGPAPTKTKQSSETVVGAVAVRAPKGQGPVDGKGRTRNGKSISDLESKSAASKGATSTRATTAGAVPVSGRSRHAKLPDADDSQNGDFTSRRSRRPMQKDGYMPDAYHMSNVTTADAESVYSEFTGHSVITEQIRNTSGSGRRYPQNIGDRINSIISTISSSNSTATRDGAVARVRSGVNPTAMRMDDQGHAMSEEEMRDVWRSEGKCVTCGLVRTHKKVKFGPFGVFRRMEALTLQGRSYKGYCLRCNNVHQLREILGDPSIPLDLPRQDSRLLHNHLQSSMRSLRSTQGDVVHRKKQTPMQAMCSSWKFQICLGVCAVALVAGAVTAAVVLSADSEPFISTPPTISPTSTPTTSFPSASPTFLEWTVKAEIVPQDNITSFAYAIDLSAAGDRIAIASPYDGEGRGRVDVFGVDNTDEATELWTLLANPILGDQVGDLAGLGMDLSADGTVVAVGSPGTKQGSVRVYRLVNNRWTQIGQTILGPSSNQSNETTRFGQAVAIDRNGTSLVVGAPHYSHVDNSHEGMVRFYRLASDQTWSMESEFVGSSRGFELGFDVDINFAGEYATVGAPGDDTRWTNGGQIYWYRYDGKQWSEFLDENTILIAGDEDDRFGQKIDMSDAGSTVAVGVPQASVRGVENAGFVSIWSLTIFFDINLLGDPISGTYPRNGFGTSFALDELGRSMIVTGANGQNISGSARVFSIYAIQEWILVGEPIPGVELGSQAWIGKGPSVAYGNSQNRVALGYESVRLPNGQSRPLVRIMEYYGVAASPSDEPNIFNRTDNS